MLSGGHGIGRRIWMKPEIKKDLETGGLTAYTAYHRVAMSKSAEQIDAGNLQGIPSKGSLRNQKG